MGEKQTLTFIEACEAMRPLNCEELQGDLLPREAVRQCITTMQNLVWQLAHEKDASVRRNTYMLLVQLNREFGVPTIAPEQMLGADAKADGYLLPHNAEGGAA